MPVMNNTTQFTASVSWSLLPSTKITLNAILSLWSLTVNVLVIAVVFANAHLRTRFNFLVVNMAFSDLIVPLMVLPIQIVDEARGRPYEWLVGGPFGNALCKLCNFFMDISPGVSMLSLVVMAVNRFVAIAYPLRIQTSRKRKIVLLIAFTWIVSMVILSPHLYTFRLKDSPKYLMCFTTWEPHFNNIISSTVLHSIFIIVLFIIPFIVISILYTVLIYKIYKMSKGVQNMLNNEQLRYRERRNRQIFYISVIVVLVFALFWGPFFSFLFTVAFIWRYNNIPPYVISHYTDIFFIVTFLGYVNSAINPSLYFLLMKSFRKGLKKLCHRQIQSCEHETTSTFRLNTFSAKLHINGRQVARNADSQL